MRRFLIIDMLPNQCADVFGEQVVEETVRAHNNDIIVCHDVSGRVRLRGPRVTLSSLIWRIESVLLRLRLE